MNIVLVGYRGTGKSVVGEILARRLNRPCIGMDAEIVRRAGMPIPEIVQKFGWPGFRDMETEVTRELSDRDGLIIDTGGGIIERPDNIKALQKNGVIFWLTASVAVIVSRIADDTQRPALTAGKTFTKEVAEVLARRTPKYRALAHHEIDTDKATPDQAAGQIIAICRDLHGFSADPCSNSQS
jgi:shikimate kinase